MGTVECPRCKCDHTHIDKKSPMETPPKEFILFMWCEGCGQCFNLKVAFHKGITSVVLE